MSTIRKVARLIDPRFVIEGAGVLLRRSIAPQASNEFDPFLLFDHFAFNDPIEGPIRGFPMHPHRGIETVTYMLEGSTHHRDSLGNSGLIGPGDVQWMTSGSGILHEEMPRRGPSGNIYGFHLWVNLPSALKMTTPRYQEVSSSRIPSHAAGGVKLRVVAGAADGIDGPVKEIAAAPLYLDVELAPATTFKQEVAADHTVLAYVFSGEATFGDREVAAVRMIQFEPGDLVQVQTDNLAVRFMLIAGRPFREPIAPYGPFVMNTREEIMEALSDLRNGTFIRSQPATTAADA
jgi:redox-sensitive bicupin YhaK (pirin superfamily)